MLCDVICGCCFSHICTYNLFTLRKAGSPLSFSVQSELFSKWTDYGPRCEAWLGDCYGSVLGSTGLVLASNASPLQFMPHWQNQTFTDQFLAKPGEVLRCWIWVPMAPPMARNSRSPVDLPPFTECFTPYPLHMRHCSRESEAHVTSTQYSQDERHVF